MPAPFPFPTAQRCTDFLRDRLGSGIQFQQLQSDERIRIEKAIRANALCAACQLSIEGEVGLIEAGERADLIIADRDIPEVPAERSHEARVMPTVMEGILRDRAARTERSELIAPFRFLEVQKQAQARQATRSARWLLRALPLRAVRW